MAPTPILGPRARRVLADERLAEQRKRRKLLTLIAAYADAGVTDPPFKELRRRTGYDREVGRKRNGGAVHQLDALLGALERDGLLRVERRPGRSHLRSRYVLLEHDV